MSAEALALQALSGVVPVLVEAAVTAIAAAMDTGKTEEEALAAAKASLPARIDTADEDAERRARIAKRHGLDAATVVTDRDLVARIDRDIATRLAAFGRRDTEPPQIDHLDALRTLSIAGPLREREVAAVRWAIEALEGGPRLRNGG